MVAAPLMNEAGLPRLQRWRQFDHDVSMGCAKRLPRERFRPLAVCGLADSGRTAPDPVVRILKLPAPNQTYFFPAKKLLLARISHVTAQWVHTILPRPLHRCQFLRRSC